MQAALWHARDDIRVETIPEPSAPGLGEIIIKVDACGICGTDLEEYRAGPLFIPVGEPHPLTGRQAPIVLGHEFAGEVVEVGSGVTALRPGDRVAPDVLIYCGACYWCRRHQVSLCEKMAALGLSGDGGLAEYCTAPVAMCVKLPNGMSYEHAALAEPLAVAVRAVRKGRVGLGDTVAIVGGGTIGLFALQAARVAGASAVYVVEPHAWRRDLALRLGADAAIDPREASAAEQLRAVTDIGPDIAIDASGVPAATLSAIDAVRRGGRVVIVALPIASTTINFMSIVNTEKEIIGSLSHIYDEDYAAAIRLLSDGRVQAEPLISDRIALADLLAKGLHRLEAQAADTLKILVRPGD